MKRASIAFVFILHCLCIDSAFAQTRTPSFSVEMDNLNFFRNNEYGGTVIKGYTLPGLWLQPKVIYTPSGHIRLEAGLHAILYHGSDTYPALAYQGIPQQKAPYYQSGAHLLPWFRAQASLGDYLTIVWGNLYGAALHRLPEPLYNPELNLTADPETGLQILLHTRPVEADLWVNWQNFIFQGDRHQEVFTFGLSSRIRCNSPDAPLHFYIPLTQIGQHRGGEIDDPQSSVRIQTLINASTGVGMQWQTGHHLVHGLHAEALFVSHIQQAGNLWPIKQGHGYYALIAADIYPFRPTPSSSLSSSYFLLTASRFHNRDFISLYGLPFFSALSSKVEGLTYHHPTLTTLGLEYIRHFGKDCTLTLDCILYHRDADDRTLVPSGSAISHSASLTLRLSLRRMNNEQ